MTKRVKTLTMAILSRLSSNHNPVGNLTETSKALSASIITQLFSLALLLFLIAGCGGPKKSGEGEYKSRIPSSLKYMPQNNGVFLQWRPNFGSGGASRGYNFYIVPDSELTDNFPSDVSKPHNSIPYPGDTNSDQRIAGQTIETAELSSLLNGVPYTAVVRNLLSDGSESKPSNVIHFTPMPGGEFSLQIRYKGQEDGFTFANDSTARADNVLNDLYFVSTAKGDFLGSPSKLSFGLRSTRFRKVGNFNSLLDAAGVASGGSKSDEVKIKVGDTFEALTENNHYARIRVLEFSGSGKDRIVKLEYLYQTVPAANSF